MFFGGGFFDFRKANSMDDLLGKYINNEIK
jgi:hypothetical protein